MFPVFVFAQSFPPLIVEEEDGAPTGVTTKIKVTNGALSRTGTVATITTGGGSGDVTSVGDVASGAAFDGTQGTTLTFNNAGGDATLLYDGSTYEIDKSLEFIGNYFIRWQNNDDDTSYMYIQATSAVGGGATLSSVNVPFNLKYGATGSDVQLSMDTSGNLIWNYDANDADFTINKNTSGQAYIYDAGVDTHTFSSPMDMESYASLGNGSALDSSYTMIIDRDFTDSGNSNVAQLSIGGIITKNTFAPDNSVSGLNVRPEGIILDAISPPVTASAVFTEPVITEPNGGAALIATTVYIKDAPTEGTSNFALKVDDGITGLDGDVILGGTLTFPDSNVSPDAAGKLVYDNTVAGFDDGLFAWYDDDEIRYFVDLDTLPEDINDDYVIAYDMDADKFYMKVDATGAGGGDPVLVNTTAVTDGSGVDLTSGTGVTVTLNAGVSPDTATFAATLGTSIAAAEMADADFGEFTCSAGTCTVDDDAVSLDNLSDVEVASPAGGHILVYNETPPPAQWNNVAMSGDVTITSAGVATVADNSHDHSAAGSTVTINAADITDLNAGTAITADLEEEVTEGSLADSTIVSGDIKDGTLTMADHAAFSSSDLYGKVSDETGSASGSPLVVFNTNPTLTGINMAGAITLNEQGIVLDSAISGDGYYSGITEAGTAGATLAFGDLVYLNNDDSRWELVDANLSDGYDKKLGICVLAAAADGNATTILLWGKVNAATAFPALTVGAPAYMSETAGDIVTAQPTTTDVAIRVVGYGNSADELFFCPSANYITHT